MNLQCVRLAARLLVTLMFAGHMTVAFGQVRFPNTRAFVQETSVESTDERPTKEWYLNEARMVLDIAVTGARKIPEQSTSALQLARIAFRVWSRERDRARSLFDEAVEIVDLEAKQDGLRGVTAREARGEIIRLFATCDSERAAKVVLAYAEQQEAARVSREDARSSADLFAQVALDLVRKDPERAGAMIEASLATGVVSRSVISLVIKLGPAKGSEVLARAVQVAATSSPPSIADLYVLNLGLQIFLRDDPTKLGPWGTPTLAKLWLHGMSSGLDLAYGVINSQSRPNEHGISEDDLAVAYLLHQNSRFLSTVYSTFAPDEMGTVLAKLQVIASATPDSARNRIDLGRAYGDLNKRNPEDVIAEAERMANTQTGDTLLAAAAYQLANRKGDTYSEAKARLTVTKIKDDSARAMASDEINLAFAGNAFDDADWTRLRNCIAKVSSADLRVSALGAASLGAAKKAKSTEATELAALALKVSKTAPRTLRAALGLVWASQALAISQDLVSSASVFRESLFVLDRVTDLRFTGVDTTPMRLFDLGTGFNGPAVSASTPPSVSELQFANSVRPVVEDDPIGAALLAQAATTPFWRSQVALEVALVLFERA